MSSNTQKDIDSGLNLEELAQRSAPKEDIAIRIDEAQEVKKRQLIAEENSIRIAEEHRKEKRKARFRLIIILLIIVAPILAYYVYSQFVSHEINGFPGSKGEQTTFSADVTTPFDGYLLKGARVVVPGQGTFKVRAYDFYSNKFIKGKDVLTNPVRLQEILTGIQSEVQNAWIVIFAGASEEGDEEFNLELCNNRVNAVGRIMYVDVGIKALGYWGIRAGRYKSSPGEHSSEQAPNLPLSPEAQEAKRSRQRRLIVAAIAPERSIPSNKGEQLLNTIVDDLVENDFFPANYEYSRSAPTPLVFPER